ncbi:MAG TPA: hypothetical protein VFZ34_07805 [Blastocatellia bacterium]|nr:hypothetical protein [Blastocatellia bacterium]
MTEYFRAEINGEAQACAQLIQELRTSTWDLFVDNQGYLVVSEAEWDKLDQFAQAHHCQLEALGLYQQAA